MKVHDYDKILFRFLSIISRLSDGEILYKDALAEEFNVSSKTIQRDFNERLMTRFPLEKQGNGWKMMEGYHVEKSRAMEDLLVLDILKTLSGGLGKEFAKRSQSLLNKLSDSEANVFYTRVYFEDISRLTKSFDLLEKAIQESSLVQFLHKDKYRLVKPYRLVNFDGYWYLFAQEINDGRIKTFHIARIQEIMITQEHFTKDSSLQSHLEKAINAWFVPDQDAYDVVLHIDAAIKRYILDHPIAPTQRILSEEQDGSIILGLEITHEKEILSTIFKWIPYITVVFPHSLKECVLKESQIFLDKQKAL